MHSLGWLEPRRFDQNDVILKRCVARYHAFLDLSSVNPLSVPTLDIVCLFSFIHSGIQADTL
jgi:hypothetical protein